MVSSYNVNCESNAFTPKNAQTLTHQQKDVFRVSRMCFVIRTFCTIRLNSSKTCYAIKYSKKASLILAETVDEQRDERVHRKN